MRRLAALCATLGLALPAVAAAQDAMVDAAVERYAAEIIELRHHFHQYPELGNREFETARAVAAHLEKLGFDEIRTGVAHTGVVGILKGAVRGPVVAVRADMDALPVTEDTPYPFKSTVRTTYLGMDVGVSHACGHDVHTAVQLGVASVLASMRDELPGTVIFIFQPSEEGPPPGEDGGAPLMVQEGVLENPRPSAIFALHTNPSLEVGEVGYTSGPIYASSDHFAITIRGQQAHGAAPHLSIDPIVMASQAVTAFQTIRSRNLSPLEPSVLSVGIFRSGERFNIIPAEVYMEGTVRAYNPDVRDAIERRMDEILAGITQAGGGAYEFTYSRGAPPTINDADLADRAAITMSRVLGGENVHVMEPLMAAEDFAFFANIVPGFYLTLGTTKPGTTSGWNHTPNFMADDGSVPVGMRVMSNLLLEYLKAEGAGH